MAVNRLWSGSCFAGFVGGATLTVLVPDAVGDLGKLWIKWLHAMIAPRYIRNVGPGAPPAMATTSATLSGELNS